MNIMQVLILLPIVLYLGDALGEYVLCEAIPELNRVKNHVWILPFISIAYIRRLLFDEKIGALSRPKAVWRFVTMPGRSVFIAYAYAGAVKETKKQNTKVEKRSSTFQFGLYKVSIAFAGMQLR